MKMKNAEKIICFILSVVLLITVAAGGFTVNAKPEDYGTCGKNVRWHFDEDTKTLTVAGNGKMFDYISSPWYGLDIINVNVSAGVTSVGENAFADLKKLESVVLPETILSIEDGAFAGCRALKNISVPQSTEYLGGGVFDDCVLLNTYEYGNCSYLGNTNNNYVVLLKADNLTITSAAINTNTKIIYDSAFADCSKITSIDIPEGVIAINDGAFESCLGLTSITVPSTLNYLGSYVFDSCNALQGTASKGIIYLKNSNGSNIIAYKTVADYANSDIYIAGTVKIIYDNLLKDRYDITEIRCTPSVWTSIGMNAFSGCVPFTVNKAYSTTLTLSKNCVKIGYEAFSNCEELESLNIYNGIKRIDNRAFYGCTGIKNIYLGNCIEKIGNLAFANLNSLENVYFVGSKDEYDNIDVKNGNTELENKMIFNSSYECAHTSTHQTATVEATCCSLGHYANTVCDNCGQVIAKGATIQMKTHSNTNRVQNATADKDGFSETYCTVCGKYEVNVLSKENNDGIITIGTSMGCPGDKIEITIDIVKNPGIISMALTLNYDKSILQLVSVKDSGILGTLNYQSNLSAEPFKLSWENDTAKEDITSTGTAAILVFEISDEAVAGTSTDISLTYDASKSEIVSYYLANRDFTINKGSVTVAQKNKGDVNGDGKVNSVDRIILSRYIAGWDNYLLINTTNADINNDNIVNSSDRILLSRYLAGWSDSGSYFE